MTFPNYAKGMEAIKKIAGLFTLLLATALIGATFDRAGLEVPRSVQALRISTGSIRIDGSMDDPAWNDAVFASKFIQRDPLEGEPATEDTEFAILYDEQYIYVGIKAYDSEPHSIRGILSRRDERTPSDWVHVSFDSYGDYRTAFEFWLNPQGVKRDVRRFDESLDENWDAIWEGKAAVHPDGWSAEFRIPFRELRFSDGANQSWGMQVYRHISRKNEDDYWTFWPKEEAGWVRHYGRLTNLQNIPRQRRLYIAPYTTGQYATSASYKTPVHPDTYDLSRNLGADIKFGLTSNLTLDLTLNPDFGQVEADPAELNLSAFESFFTEKRPFFVEGSNIFNFPLGTGFNGQSSLFYPRRIGRNPQYSPSSDGFVDMPNATAILGAGKLSGKTSSGWSIGVMNATTAEEQATIRFEDSPSAHATVEPLTNFFVSRLQKDFRQGNTSLGGIVTSVNRGINAEHLQFLHKRAYSGGLDFSHRFADDTYQLEAMVATSTVYGTEEAILRTQLGANHYFQRPDARHLQVDSSATSLSGYVHKLVLSRVKGEHWRWMIQEVTYSPGFESNDLGFHQAVDRTGQGIWVQYREDDPGRVIRQWRLNLNGWSTFTFSGFNEPIGLGGNLNGNMTFMNYWRAGMGLNLNSRVLHRTVLWGGPAMTQDPGRNLFAFVGSDDRKAISANFATFRGSQSANGVRWKGFNPSLTWRPTNAFSLSLASQLFFMHDTWAFWSDFSAVTDEQTGQEHYIMATLDQTTLTTTLRFDFTLTPTLSIQYYGSPFVTAGAYSGDKLVRLENVRARRFDDRFRPFTSQEQNFDGNPNTYDIDGDGVANFDLGNRDFNYKQFNSNLVVRWEYQTGSAIYFVWSRNMSQSVDVGDFALGQDLRRLFGANAENIFLIKASYLLNI